MSNYFVHLTADYWTAKNKLEKDCKEIAKRHNGTLCKTIGDLHDWLKTLRAEIEAAEAKNPRCKKMDLNVWQNKGVLLVQIIGVFTIQALPVLNYWGKEDTE